MSKDGKLDEIKNRLGEIADVIEASPRRDETGDLEGWGQFVDATAHAHQIGSYGTAAALLVLHTADAKYNVNDRVIAQIEELWRGDSRASKKLRTQNVRIAFLIIALSKVLNPNLVAVRSEAIEELRSRQIENGAWGDWDHQTELPQARLEATAWVALALDLVNPGDAFAVRGAEFLLDEQRAAGQSKRLSQLAVGAALAILPKEKAERLLFRATEMLRQSAIDDSEAIAFFDYIEDSNGGTRISRDYICYPEVYSISLLLRGAIKNCGKIGSIGLAFRREETISKILTLIDDARPYKLRGAKFASTVDQAMLCLTYDNLVRSGSALSDLASIISPIQNWLSDGWVGRVVVPIILLGAAGATLEDPASVIHVLEMVSGNDLEATEDWVNTNESPIRIVVAALLALSSNLPASIWRFVKQRIL
ncbi:hypothetical protein AAG602_09640 [Citromicrobium bathyomarinum]